MNVSVSSSKKKRSLSDYYNSARKVVNDMAKTLKGVTMQQGSLRSVSDEALDEIIRNTQANQASLNKLYNELINERVRRGLKLPDRRFVDDDRTPQF